VVHRRFAREHLLPLFLEAPFMHRAAEKPLGYAGDYEMMNMLYREHTEGGSLFGKVLNLYATQEGAARANINRIDYLGAQVRELVGTAHATRLRVASIGCGPAQEIRRLLEESPGIGPSLDVALIDQEERSIAYCERTLGPLALETGARIDFMRESVRRLLTTRELSRALGTRDLIYSAGLFDYLNQAMFARLLSTLYEALVPGGVLLVGNVAVNNPSRWSMEYYVEWFLIHRSPEDLRAFGEALVPTPSCVEVESEPTGINLFLRVVK
jgi:extracellular factor (EF) 3-hydroxypalmitic acid methyl ester biosynthesis protein